MNLIFVLNLSHVIDKNWQWLALKGLELFIYYK